MNILAPRKQIPPTSLADAYETAVCIETILRRVVERIDGRRVLLDPREQANASAFTRADVKRMLHEEGLRDFDLEWSGAQFNVVPARGENT